MAPTPTADKCPAYRTTAQCRRPRHNIILLLAPSPRRPVRGRAVCVSEHQGAGWSVSGISEKGRCVSGCREHQGGSGHRPVRGGGPGKGVGVGMRTRACIRGVGAHVKARARGGCVRVSGVCQDVRRGGAYREYQGGRRARERRPYCDIVIFFEKICFLGKKPYLCNASLDRFDPKIGHLF